MRASQKQQIESTDYWDRQPCGSLHLEPTTQRYFVQPHILKFAQFDRWKGKDVLEIGCGIGTDAIEFAIAGASYVSAIDTSQKSLELAKRRVNNLRLSNISFGLGMGRLHKGVYDLVYSFGVIHHVEEPEWLLEQACDAMKTDGELRIMLYAKWSWKHFWRIQPEAQAGCPLVRWYSAREARRLLESCGFRVVSIQKTHIFPYRVKDYIEHRFVKAFPWNVTPKWLFRWLESKIGHQLLLVARKA